MSENVRDICWFGENDISTNDEFLNEDVDHGDTKEAPFKLNVTKYIST